MDGADNAQAAIAPRKGRAAPVALALLVALSVPFIVTGLFRLGLTSGVVVVLCLAAAGALFAVPRYGPWLSLSWLMGCGLWMLAFVLILRPFGEGLANVD
ncbi:MAG: hypothetical protein LC779_04615 [Actinobacteria bacterium]|nr:hypothetical protein [Actinomycetota bacterium]